MNRKLSLLGIIVIIAVITTIFYSGWIDQPEEDKGTDKSSSSPIELNDGNATSQGVSEVVNISNDFAFDFYNELKDEEGNIFFSPYSISFALAMTYEGARGQTAEEMASVLHFPENNTTRRNSYASIYNQLNEEDKEYVLNTANSVWAQEDYPFLEEYFKVLEQYYAAMATNLNFVDDPEGSREIINDWVEEQTNDKIKDLIPQGYISALTRLVLTNAIYFKSNWDKQFDEEYTMEQDFRVSPEKTVKVPMMSMNGETFNYTETEDLQILELPYDGEELSMLILLPKDDSLDTVEASINADELRGWRNDLVEEKIDLYMPKFTFETKYFMRDILKKMGMPTAFTPGEADFSGMDGTRNLFIGHVIHQAFVEVNEEGTEAAAATSVGMELTAVPQANTLFRADHPFIFLIQERGSGNILFMGRMADPSQ